MKYLFAICAYCLMLIGCQNPATEMAADYVYANGNFQTLDSAFSVVECIAIKDGRIVFVGSDAEGMSYRGKNTEVIDLDGAFAMPGLIEGHGHFTGLGSSLQNLNFLTVKSWEDIVEMVKAKVADAEPGEWIIGRGWHQEKWDTSPDRNILGYPYHDALTAISPENPVLLRHASGHASFANTAAMEAAGVSKETANPAGGNILRDAQGEAIGVFEERAQYILQQAYRDYLEGLDAQAQYDKWREAIDLAEAECFENGITSFQDAGTPISVLNQLEELANKDALDIRLWAMIRDSLGAVKEHASNYPKVGIKDHLTIRAVKTSIDGALGSFGAWLLEPYNDKTGFYGQNTADVMEVRDIAKICVENGLQYCVHAIGDRANRVTLDIYEGTFSQYPNTKNHRFRIEHAQHVDTSDIDRFAKMGVIAAFQGIHCTSDAPFVEKRLGTDRARYGSYAWRSFIDKGVAIGNGTDVPVEDIDPFASLYASVSRKRVDTGLEFYPEQTMTRKEALLSYTLWNAYAAFEENEKGSLEVGKLGDIVVLSKNLLNCTDTEILDTEVLYTIVGGVIKYQKG